MRKDSSCKENVLSRKEKTERQKQNPCSNKKVQGSACRLRDEEVVLEMNTREKEKVWGTD